MVNEITLEEREMGNVLSLTTSGDETLRATKDPIAGDWVCVRETDNSLLQESVQTKPDAVVWLAEKAGILETAEYEYSNRTP